jgi:hypothetical protein
MGSTYSHDNRDESVLNGCRTVRHEEIQKNSKGLIMTYTYEGVDGNRKIIITKSEKNKFRFVHTYDGQTDKIDIIYPKDELLKLLKEPELCSHLQFMINYLEIRDR